MMMIKSKYPNIRVNVLVFNVLVSVGDEVYKDESTSQTIA